MRNSEFGMRNELRKIYTLFFMGRWWNYEKEKVNI